MDMSPQARALIQQTADSFAGAQRRQYIARTLTQLGLSQRHA